MDQGLETAASTGTRPVLHALRPLLVLGGFVLLWWCLSIGAAQASEGPHDALGTPIRALDGTADRVVSTTVQHAADHTRSAHHVSTQVTAPVRHRAAPVTPTVRAVVQKLPAAPVVHAAVKTVRSQLVAALDQAGKTLPTTRLGSPTEPVLTTVKNVASQLPRTSGSSALQGEAASQGAAAHHPTAAPSNLSAADLAGTSRTALDGQDHASANSPTGAPSDDHVLPASGIAGAAMQSGADPGAAPAVCEGTRRNGPDGSKTAIASLVDRHAAGPTYPPSSPPD